jgi:high affinity Mn2+ porin
VLKGLFLGSVAVLTASSYAIAADPSATMPLKAAQTSHGVPSSYDWSGFYVGGHLGQAWGRSNWLEAPDMISGSFSLYEPFDAFQTTGSIFAGLQAGYDYVLPNRLVVGVVADVSAPSFPNHDGISIGGMSAFALVAFEREHVISFTVHDFLSDAALAAHRVNSDDRSSDGHHVE